MKKFLLYIFMISALLLSSCSNISDEIHDRHACNETNVTVAANGNSAENSTQKYITVTGAVGFVGAYPQEIVNQIEQNYTSASARTAFPNPVLSDFSYDIKAISATGTIAGEATENGKTYRVTIPVSSDSISYKVHIEAKTKSSTPKLVLKGESEEFSIGPESHESQAYSANVVLCVSSDSEINGGVELTVMLDTESGITAATASIGGIEITGTVSENSITFKTADENSIPCGAHKTRFSFSNASDEIYSFTQIVNVFQNLYTNAWVQNGAEPYFTTTTSGGIKTTNCKITKPLVDGYTLTEIYVDPTSEDDNGSGSFMHPKKKFNTALTMLKNKDANYTIFIKGTVKESYNSNYAHVIPESLKNDGSGTTNAKSLTICGVREPDANGVPKDALDGNRTSCALWIENTNVPIIIKNLKITEGKYKEGGGIHTDSGSQTLTLAKGAYIKANTSDTDTGKTGGGIYFGGAELKMLDGAVIEGNSAGTNGGGIYLCSGKTFTMNGGIIRGNEAGQHGGALYVNGGTFTMTGGVIGDDSKDTAAKNEEGCYSNKAGQMGGGVYLGSNTANSSEASLIGGIIAYNYADTHGGALAFLDCNDALIKNTIKCNGASLSSGGIMAAPNNNKQIHVTLDDGCRLLKNVSYFTPSDGGVDWGGGAVGIWPTLDDNTQVCDFRIKGSVSIPSDGAKQNDIWLSSPGIDEAKTYLTIDGHLTGSGKFTITPDKIGYVADRIVLKAASGVTLANEVSKFTVTKDASDPNRPWKIDSSGKLQGGTIIESVSDLKNLIDPYNSNTSKSTKDLYIILNSDITVNNSNYTPYVETFEGTFDGKGHTITIQSINSPDRLFTAIAKHNSGIIQNVVVELASGVTLPTITEGSTSTTYECIGSICLENKEGGIIRNCWNKINIPNLEFYNRRGGICIENKGRIENCLNTGNITGKYTKSWSGEYGYLGGITGKNFSGAKILNCVNYGTIIVNGGYAAAICGITVSGSTIENCYWKKDCSSNGSTTNNYMVYNNSSNRNGSHTGCGYFEGNTGTTLTAGNSSECKTSQTLAYGTNLLDALNAYVDANPGKGLKKWKSDGTYAAVLEY